MNVDGDPVITTNTPGKVTSCEEDQDQCNVTFDVVTDAKGDIQQVDKYTVARAELRLTAAPAAPPPGVTKLPSVRPSSAPNGSDPAAASSTGAPAAAASPPPAPIAEEEEGGGQ